MKILMVARWPVGGIRTFLRYVFCEPVFDDCSITFLAPGEGLADDLDGFLDLDRFKVIAVEESSRALLVAARNHLSRESFDLLHSHGLIAGVICQLARFGREVPHLLTMHDVFLKSTFSGGVGRAKLFALKRMLSGIDCIHAVGNDCARNFRQHIDSVAARKIIAIPNGVDTRRFADAEPLDLRYEFSLPADAALIGFFGRFMAQKGFRSLVDAIELIVQQGFGRPLRVVTFGWGGFVREDYQYIESKGLKEHFIQKPHTDEPERWLKGLDVVAVPSRWEACPLLPMEALAAGAPIVGTTCVGLREVLEGSPARMVTPGDVGGLADALRAELEQPRLREFAYYSSTAVARFAVGESAVKLRSLYANLVAD